LQFVDDFLEVFEVDFAAADLVYPSREIFGDAESVVEQRGVDAPQSDGSSGEEFREVVVLASGRVSLQVSRRLVSLRKRCQYRVQYSLPHKYPTALNDPNSSIEETPLVRTPTSIS
jgi:hypothetical protein